MRGLLFLMLLCQWASAHVPDHCQQLIVTVADHWNTHRGQMMLYERKQPGAAWNASLKTTVPVLLGKRGLAWGIGLLPVPHGEAGIPSKREKDGRAPAGCFALGKCYGHAAAAPAPSLWPYHQVTAQDCWIDDVAHPSYNRHVRVDLKNPPVWYEKQRMRLGDNAYEWLLEIKHNTNPPVAGAGSAIFFHVRRGENIPTAGCTTMERGQLRQLLTWLNPSARPCYVLLPKQEYVARQQIWKLPRFP
jgi:L,D-peptidoglycan transpeptidase YkuD (ErfK/YbiS/YcfS/YnhG family)